MKTTTNIFAKFNLIILALLLFFGLLSAILPTQNANVGKKSTAHTNMTPWQMMKFSRKISLELLKNHIKKYNTREVGRSLW